MLSGMVKLVLAKLNMSTVTTWFGGQGSDAGMNLLQQYFQSCPDACFLAYPF